MTEVPDHRLDAMLVALTTGDAEARPLGRKGKSRTRSRSVFDIVLWSAVTNVVLLACFLVGWNLRDVRQLFAPKPVASVAVSGKSTDPLAVSRYERADNELLTKGPQRQLKGPLQLTLVPNEQLQSPPEELITASLPDDATAPEQEQGDGYGEVTTGPEDPLKMVRVPLLRRARSSGNLEIGSFNTVTMGGQSADCLDTAYGLLEDAGAARDKLKVLAQTPAITVARICAANGSLVVTCRSNQITISPRKLKPNETCTG